MSRWLAGGLGGKHPENQVTKQHVPESEDITHFKCNLCEEKHPQSIMSIVGVDKDENDIHKCHYCLGKKIRPTSQNVEHECIEHECVVDDGGMFCSEPTCGRLMV